MGLFNKIKNVLFTEEEETVEIPVIKKEKREEPHYERVVERPESKEVEIEQPRIKREMPIEEPVRREEPEKNEKSPFQQFDEEEFDRIAAINKSRLLERDRKAREEKERNERIQENKVERVESSRELLRSRDTHKEKLLSDPRIIRNTVKEEEHRFKPSPVISPVYGILDKNYSKEDILPRASSEGTLPKVMDVDKVRQKAFGTLEDLEKTMSIPKSEPEAELEDIDVKITSFEDQVDDDTKNVLTKEDLKEIAEYTKEMDISEDLDNNIKEEAPIDLETSSKEIAEKNDKEDKVSDATLENELFDLIDSMYQDKEDE